MGPGAGEKYDNGTTTPVYFNQAVQITKEAEWETDSKEKSVVDVFKDSFKLNLRQFRINLEGLVASSDGSGTSSNGFQRLDCRPVDSYKRE